MSDTVRVGELLLGNTGSMYDVRGCFVYAYRLSVELAFVSKVFGLAAL
jgi:hypothetical protein